MVKFLKYFSKELGVQKVQRHDLTGGRTPLKAVLYLVIRN
jgi:hypothetical protein